jgi:UDP-N-acetyl-D-mannosaminuronic acid dehydrogenase
LGEAALAVNESMPQVIVQQLRRECDLPKLTVGILGMAFKPESDDPRDSLSYKLRDLLRGECRRVLCTDPYVADPELVPLAKVVRHADILVVGTPHECYRSLKCSQTVFDLTDSGCGADWNGLVVRRTQVIRQSRARQAGYLASRNGKSRQRKRA